MAVITAKDKLRRLLGHGVHQGICFSAEKAHEAQQAEHGIDDVNALVGWDTPEVYSSQLSEFVLEAGLRVFERYQPALMYLSLTDYIQHKHAPGTVESDRFHQCLDQYFGAFDARGAVVGITADHGMNDKNNALGQPQIIYLSQLLSTWFGLRRRGSFCPLPTPTSCITAPLARLPLSILIQPLLPSRLWGNSRLWQGSSTSAPVTRPVASSNSP